MITTKSRMMKIVLRLFLAMALYIVGHLARIRDFDTPRAATQSD
jgi:hypothetical protein